MNHRDPEQRRAWLEGYSAGWRHLAAQLNDPQRKDRIAQLERILALIADADAERGQA